MVNLNPFIPKTTLKVNYLNTIIKRQVLTGWVKKKDLKICCLKGPNFTYKVNDENNRMKKTYTMKIS